MKPSSVLVATKPGFFGAFQMFVNVSFKIRCSLNQALSPVMESITVIESSIAIELITVIELQCKVIQKVV